MLLVLLLLLMLLLPLARCSGESTNPSFSANKSSEEFNPELGRYGAAHVRSSAGLSKGAHSRTKLIAARP